MNINGKFVKQVSELESVFIFRKFEFLKLDRLINYKLLKKDLNHRDEIIIIQKKRCHQY